MFKEKVAMKKINLECQLSCFYRNVSLSRPSASYKGKVSTCHTETEEGARKAEVDFMAVLAKGRGGGGGWSDYKESKKSRIVNLFFCYDFIEQLDKRINLQKISKSIYKKITLC